MKNINNLTQKELKKQLNYNPDTGIFIWIIGKTNRVNAGDRAGYKNGRGYMQIKINNKQYILSRLAWLYMTGEWPEHFIDHINGITDDDRFCNLRDATPTQNSINKKIPSTNTSGFKGVSFRKGAKKWTAQIRMNGKKKHLGYFDCPKKASKAYEDAAKEVFGEYRRESDK